MKMLTPWLVVFFSSFVAVASQVTVTSVAADRASVLKKPQEKSLGRPIPNRDNFGSRPIRTKVQNARKEDVCPPKAMKEFGEKYFKVYGDYCFMFMTHKKEYYERALMKCWKHGGILAMPKTQELLTFLLNKLKHEFTYKKPVWIGMNDRYEEGTMRWTDGSPVELKESNFDAYNHGWFGELEDCVALDPRDNLFHDYPCNGIFGVGEKAFVCQYGKENFNWFKIQEFWDTD